MRIAIPLTVLLLVGLSVVASFAITPSKGQSGGKSSSGCVECPKNVPDNLPDQFPLLIEIVNTIHAQMSTGRIASIQETFLRHGLLQRGGDAMEIRLGFSSLGGITSMVVEINPNSGEPKKMIGVKRRPTTEEVVGFSQLNLLWNGSCEVDVEKGSVRSYHEGYIDFDDESGRIKAFGLIGLQVDWSPQGEIVREEYLKTRHPFRLKIGGDEGSDSP